MYFLVEISQSVETFHHFQTQKASTMSRFLNKSRLHLNKSQQISTISTNLDNLDVSQQSRQKSRLKSLDFKNLDRDNIKVDLDVMDNLDRFQNLVSTRWTFSISISIGLERRDPQA